MSLFTAAFVMLLFVVILREIRRSTYADDSVLQDGLYNITIDGEEHKDVDLFGAFRNEGVYR